MIIIKLEMIFIPSNALRAEDDCLLRRLGTVLYKENAKIKCFIVGELSCIVLLVGTDRSFLPILNYFLQS